MNVDELLAEFNKFQAHCDACDRIFCSTCGGLAGAVKRNTDKGVRS